MPGGVFRPTTTMAKRIERYSAISVINFRTLRVYVLIFAHIGQTQTTAAITKTARQFLSLFLGVRK